MGVEAAHLKTARFGFQLSLFVGLGLPRAMTLQ